ncbi:hypothetical protein AAG906_023944 [Vitis piasezkii]
MAKRRVKKTVKQSAASSQSNINDANAKEPQLEKRKDSLIDQEGMFSYLFENLPNLEVVRNGKGQFEVQWKDEAMRNAGGENMHVALLHQMSIAYPDCSAAVPSFGGFEFSSKAVKTSLLGADNLQIRDFVLEEPSETQMMGLQDAFQTPGVSSHRLSVGMTPKTLRLPKHGEMLLSVHGSPLGLYKEDNMEAIHVSENSQ